MADWLLFSLLTSPFSRDSLPLDRYDLLKRSPTYRKQTSVSAQVRGNLEAVDASALFVAKKLTSVAILVTQVRTGI